MRPVFCAVCFQFFFMKSAYEQTVWMRISQCSDVLEPAPARRRTRRTTVADEMDARRVPLRRALVQLSSRGFRRQHRAARNASRAGRASRDSGARSWLLVRIEEWQPHVLCHGGVRPNNMRNSWSVLQRFPMASGALAAKPRCWTCT